MGGHDPTTEAVSLEYGDRPTTEPDDPASDTAGNQVTA
jgi:hypothetical protein